MVLTSVSFWKISKIVVLLVSLVLVSVSPLTASALSSSTVANEGMLATALIPNVTKQECNDCWAGYFDNASSGSVTGVSTSFKVPSVVCDPSSPLVQNASFGVTFDGVRPFHDMEWAAIVASCSRGWSTPFYYGAYGDGIDGSGGAPFGASSGDVVSISIAESLGVFAFTLTDFTSRMSSTFVGSASGATLNGAGCVTGIGGSTYFALANFGKVRIGVDHTGVLGTCGVTIGGHTGPVGSFRRSIATLNKFFTYDSTGTTLLASPSALSPDGSSFSVVFKAAGP